MERFEDYVFDWHQVFLYLLARRQYDDLRKHTAGIKPSRAQLLQKVHHVVCA